MDAHRDALAAILADAALGDGQELDGVAHASGLFHVLLGDVGDTLDRDVVDSHAGVEGERGQDGTLGGGVQSLDVGRRIGLGKTQVLRLLKSVLVAQSLGAHRIQDEVRRTVDNAHHRRHAVTCEGLTQAVHDGHGAGDGSLVVEVGVVGGGSLVQLRTVRGEQGLVARHDRDALGEGAQHERARRLDAADQLDDEVHPVNGLGGVGRQQLAVDRGVARGIHIADKDSADLHLRTGAGGEILAAGLQDANDLATDGSSAKNANCEDRTGCGHRDYLLRETGTGTSVGGQRPPFPNGDLCPIIEVRETLDPHP